MARMTLAAVVGLSYLAFGASSCLAQGATTAPTWSPLPPSTSQMPSVAKPAPNVGSGQAAGTAALDACRGDMKTFCGGVARGGGRKFACLKDNQSKLSAGCQAGIQAVLDKGGNRGPDAGGKGGTKAMAACRGDIASVCAGVEKGKGGVGLCLRENAAKLSQPCQTVIAEKKALQGQMRLACKNDLTSLCGTEEKGKTRQACLREKQAQASPACQQALAALPQQRAKR